MRILVDSHVIYWAMMSPGELTPTARTALIEPSNEVFVSAASIWELKIKARKGKLHLPEGFVKALEDESFDELPVSWRHGARTAGLPMIHSDPFDRILIAQALEEGLVLMTRDSLIRKYDVPTVGA